MTGDREPIGRRIVVTGLAGSGKSTVSVAIAERTRLPLIHLDLAFWKPGWVAPSDDEWQATQERLLAADEWIADGNYTDTLALRVARADTVIVLDLPWRTCIARSIRRGFRLIEDREMPEGCPDSRWRGIGEGFGIAWRTWRKRHTEPAKEREIIERVGSHARVHVIRSRHEADAFVAGLGA